jgi:hypothetical protein
MSNPETMAAEQAIRESIQRDRIVTIHGAVPGTGETLRAKCDDYVSSPQEDGSCVYEFWGSNPNEWRVHVLVEAGEVLA